MTDPSMGLTEYLHNIGMANDAVFLRESIHVMSELLMEVEVEQQIGARRLSARRTAPPSAMGTN